MSDIFNYLIIHLSDVSSVSDIVNYLIIQLYDISNMSDAFNYLIIQLYDISSMANIFNYLIIHLFNISNIFNYLTIQLFDIQWYSHYGDESDEGVGMWVIEPEMHDNGSHIIDIVHLDTIVCSAHLIAVYGYNPILKDIPLCYILDLFHLHYVNKYIDHHTSRSLFNFLAYFIGPCT